MTIRKRVSERTGKPTYYTYAWNKYTERTVYLGSFRTKAEAVKAEQVYHVGLSPDVDASATFANLGAEWMRRSNVDEHSKESYQASLAHMVRFFGEKRVDEITEADAEDFISDLVAHNLAPLSVRKIAADFMYLMKRARAWGYISALKFNNITNLPKAVRLREPRVLTPSELARIVEVAPDEYKAMMFIWPRTGLRVSEMFGLRPCDVDFDKGVIRTHRQSLLRGVKEGNKTPSSNREVTMSPATMRVLAEHIPKYSKTYLFPRPHGDLPLTEQVWSKQQVQLVRDAGIGLWRTHDFRHTFGAALIHNGASVFYVQKQLGHKNASTTLDIYGHLYDKQDTTPTDQLDTLFLVLDKN